MSPFQGFNLSLSIFYNYVIPSGLNYLTEFEINRTIIKWGVNNWKRKIGFSQIPEKYIAFLAKAILFGVRCKRDKSRFY